MDNLFCKVCGAFIGFSTYHKCKIQVQNNIYNEKNVRYKPKKWIVAYFQLIENKLPNLFVYNAKSVTNFPHYIKANVPQGSTYLTGIYSPCAEVMRRDYEKYEKLELSKGIFYFKIEKMGARHWLCVANECALYSSCDSVTTLEDKLKARLSEEWNINTDDSMRIARTIKKSLKF
ncbi:MAG: hypothetical protein QW063_00845 [Candidatus Nanoarchaeia archaeon]